MIPLNLAVRLSTSKKTMDITGEVRDLSFRTVVPGGYASCRVSLHRPLTISPDEIAYYGTLTVYDTRHGGVVWEGRLEDPGRGSGSNGEIWELAAVGPSAHAQDRKAPYIVVDTRTEPWIESRYSAKWGEVTQSDDDDQVEAIKLYARRGTVITVGSDDFIDVIYHDVRNAGMKLARVRATWDTGVTSADWRLKLLTRTDDGASPGAVDDEASNTAGGNFAGAVGDVNFSNGHNTANLRFDRDNSNVTVASDATWAVFKEIAVRAMLKDKAGADITTGYTGNTVLASQVVADLLGRFLTAFDGTNASVTTTTHAIDQLAYPDGVTPAEVLDDLMELEPDFLWEALESNSAGKYRFNWRQWPSTVRYEADVLDGFDAPSSADGLYNAVRVRWRDKKRIRNTQRTQSVPELTAAGLTREAFIDLGDEIGSSANATRAGDQFLSQHRYAPNAGRLKVSRPILDLDYGRMVMPWEIRPGYLIRVRGVQPRIDALNATTRDGVTVFRVVGVEFGAGDASATLELDSYPKTTSRAIARLAKRQIKRRR